MRHAKKTSIVLIAAGILSFGTLTTNIIAEDINEGSQDSTPRPFLTDTNPECYRSVGRGAYDKDTDRTYQVFLKDNFRPWIIFYDHSDEEWSEPVRITSSAHGSSSQPDHLYPSMWINDRGYIHVVWGAHGGSFEHLASREPHDITAWEKRGTIGRGCYAQPIATDGGKTVYLFYTQYGPRRLVYYKSEDGGDTFGSRRLVIGPGSGGRGLYIGNIKHQPATATEPEKFHIAWVFNKNVSNTLNKMYPLYYAYYNVEDSRLYNAAGEDLGESVKFPEDWETCLVSQPQLNTKFMQHHPTAGITKEGKLFVIWTEVGGIKRATSGGWFKPGGQPSFINTYFGVYDPDKGDWDISEIHEEPLPTPGSVGRGYDVNVTADGTIYMYHPADNSMKILTSEDSGKSWEVQTIYRSPAPELEAILFAGLIDSAHMGADAARHPDYQMTFKQHYSRQNCAQFAWGESGFLEPNRE